MLDTDQLFSSTLPSLAGDTLYNKSLKGSLSLFLWYCFFCGPHLGFHHHPGPASQPCAAAVDVSRNEWVDISIPDRSVTVKKAATCQNAACKHMCTAGISVFFFYSYAHCTSIHLLHVITCLSSSGVARLNL